MRLRKKRTAVMNQCRRVYGTTLWSTSLSTRTGLRFQVDTNMMRALQFAYVIFYALVTGVFWGTWFSLSRSMSELAPETFLEVGHTMIQNLGGPMSLLIPVTIVLNLAVSILLYSQRQTQAFTLATSALLLLIAALVITLSVNVPIDNEIAGWTLATLPPGWETLRDQWEWYHALRTFASLVGLGCAVGSVLLACPPVPLTRSTS
jgi:uncharacterized membrane protein